MNRQAKSAIKSLVLTLRHRLEEDIAIGLKRYGFAGERWLPLERLPHIERDDAAAADHFRLRASLEQHLRRIGAEPASATAAQRGEAVAWFVREVAFTHLNRLVALKCLEARGLIPEIITTRDAYGGRARAHYEYRFDHPAEAAAPDDALPAAIRHVCRIVYPEFRLLFDVGDPATGRKPPADDIVWPSFPVLRECIALINGLDELADGKLQMANGKRPDAPDLQPSTLNLQPPPSSLWLEDEIIGWIYQFYNAEQKEAIRGRGAPQRPAEVAVINQFFTPRWIVKFLVDNTLGRLWLEMHPDSPRVRAKCDYLVPEPLGTRDTERGGHGEGEKRFVLDPDSPINNPKAPSRRKAKRPEEIRLIDPACGAMHFGHYAFEVFQEIYADARERGWVTGADALPDEEVPAAILRHNLYGVDIDLRAVQLAALSLFIKAKSADPNAHITRMNLVVADAVLPADGVRAQFLDRYKDDRAVQDAVRQVLDEMANVAEVGSLLRVEERLRTILAKAGHRASEETARLDPRDQRPLPGMGGKGGQFALADLPEAQPEDWGAHYTVARLLDDLREFAARALQTHDLNAQLFAEEAEKSVHLLDVFLEKYDAVVMNPPYGQTLDWTRIADADKANGNLYCAFLLRAKSLLASHGYAGALTDRTYLLLNSFDEFRSAILDTMPPITAVDLGWDVLDDANVATCAAVFGPGKKLPKATFIQSLDSPEKEKRFVDQLNELRTNRKGAYTYTVDLAELEAIPTHPLCYWAPSPLRKAFRVFDRLEPTVGIVRKGLSPGDSPRFVREFWEVPRERRGMHGWAPYANGGEFSAYYRDNTSVVLWNKNGGPVKSILPRSVIRSEQLYGQAGLTYGKRHHLLNVQFLSAGHVFSNEGYLILCKEPYSETRLSAILNSNVMRFTVNLMSGLHKEVTSVKNLPVIESAIAATEEATELDSALEIHNTKSNWDTSNETCTRFTAPWLVQAQRGALLAGTTAGLNLSDLQPSTVNLQPLLDHLLAVEHAADARLQQLQTEIDDAVYDLYEITPEDRALIERELGDRPLELVWPQMAGKSDAEKRREHVRRLVSWCLLNALKEKRDGILPVTPVAGELSALDEVRGGLETEFGEAAAFRMESDIGQVLGQPLADWLDGPFIKWHTPLYKRRPIIWHLASPKNAFGCFVYLHKLDADTLRKVQTLYLWPRRRGVEAERDEAIRAKTAGAAGASRRLEAAEALLDDLAEFEKRLLSVIQAQVKCEIPEWAEGPFRNGVYDPVLDDGVKVNITPLQEAGVLRYGKVV